MISSHGFFLPFFNYSDSLEYQLPGPWVIVSWVALYDELSWTLMSWVALRWDTGVLFLFFFVNYPNTQKCQLPGHLKIIILPKLPKLQLPHHFFFTKCYGTYWFGRFELKGYPSTEIIPYHNFFRKKITLKVTLVPLIPRLIEKKCKKMGYKLGEPSNRIFGKIWPVRTL